MAPPKSDKRTMLVPSDLWPGSENVGPPKLRDVLSQIGEFLDRLGYSNAVEALDEEARDIGIEMDIPGWRGYMAHPEPRSVGLMHMWWSTSDDHHSVPTLTAEETSGGNLAEESVSDSDSDSSAQAGQKRKRVPTPDSSDSDDSTSESGSDKMKNAATPSSDSESDSDSSSDEEEVRPNKRAKLSVSDKSSVGSGSSSSDSSSGSSSSTDSSSHSDSDNSTGNSVASDSTSDSDSDSDSDSSESDSESSDSEPAPPSPSPKPKKQKKSKPQMFRSLDAPKAKAQRTGSATSSSATLSAETPTKTESNETEGEGTILISGDANGDMHPDRVKRMPATKENVQKLKKEQVPFSRIPADQKVDAKFASNSYVPYDYADRAHKDLSVTKGKDFTKEKNKKKRGAYRGGAIDIAPKGIKFED